MVSDINKIMLTESMAQAIENRKFNLLEMKGFANNPNLALLAGAAIGYQLALDLVMEEYESMRKVQS